jgi:hypothetical protein
MPRYYFVVSSPLGSEADHNGLELPGDAEARELVLRAVHPRRRSGCRLSRLAGGGSDWLGEPPGKRAFGPVYLTFKSINVVCP